QPVLQRIVGRMNEVGLSWRPDVRAEENPGFGTLDQILTIFEIRIHSHEPKLVTTHRHEMAVARGLGRSQNSHDFQPAGRAAALLAYALPPAAAWRHKNKRGKARVLSGDPGRYVNRLRRLPLYQSHDCRFGALLRLLFQPCTLYVRNLQHRWAGRIKESRRVTQKQPRPGGAGYQDYRLMLALACCGDYVGLSCMRDVAR